MTTTTALELRPVDLPATQPADSGPVRSDTTTRAGRLLSVATGTAAPGGGLLAGAAWHHQQLLIAAVVSAAALALIVLWVLHRLRSNTTKEN